LFRLCRNDYPTPEAFTPTPDHPFTLFCTIGHAPTAESAGPTDEFVESRFSAHSGRRSTRAGVAALKIQSSPTGLKRLGPLCFWSLSTRFATRAKGLAGTPVTAAVTQLGVTRAGE